MFDAGDNLIDIYQGKGDGTFTKVGTVPAGANSDGTYIVSGDFNNDGIPDLVAVSDSYLTVLFGKGDGTFPTSTTITDTVNGQSNALFGQAAVVDLNGDGNLDLVVSDNLQSSPGSYKTAFLYTLGNGAGAFSTPVTNFQNGVQTGYEFGLAVGDFNHDGRPDVALADNSDNEGVAGVDLCFQNGSSGQVAFDCTQTFDADPAVASATATAVATASLAGGGPDLALITTDLSGNSNTSAVTFW